ncbi:MAG TPA: biosynthetic peptidoglycan transglycosylase [Geodermatophilus sp.]|nr:biosynthetic peptidoglycan transglycosylase [Geodermatophilus sp.]
MAWLVAPLLLAEVALVTVVGSLTWRTPAESSFMKESPGYTHGGFVDVEHISRNLIVVAVSQEDDALPYRTGAFDVSDFVDRAEAYLAGEEDASGSTIPQQLAKNLYLDSSQTARRKGAEAIISMHMSFLLSDARIVELYLNYAQFGPDLFGICAASWYWFGQPPSYLELDQAAMLVGLLPAPSHVRRGPDGGMDFSAALAAGKDASYNTFNRATALAPEWFTRNGGYQLSEDLGIAGFAADQPPSDTDCSEMPASVRDRLLREGYPVS